MRRVNGEVLKKSLFALLREKGAELMGVGDLRGIVDGALITGVSVAVPVPRNIVLDLQTTPTREYYDAYHGLERPAGRDRGMWGGISEKSRISGPGQHHKGGKKG